jgi:endonuclease G
VHRLVIALAIVAFIVFQLIPLIPSTVAEAAPSPNVVISQVYGGGGNAGATYQNDFIELHNRGNTTVALTGWSVQYASSTGTGNFGGQASQITELPNVSLAPGQYFLIKENSSGAVGAALPAVDYTDPTPIDLSGTNGKVALVNSATTLGCNGGSTLCNATQLAKIVDLVGYGNANFFEGAGAAPVLSSILAARRNVSGGVVVDTDNNNSDFSAVTPSARNCALLAGQPCAVPTNPTATGASNPNSGAIGDTTLLTVNVTSGANPASSGITVKADLSAIGGSTTQQFLDNGANGDAVAGDNIFSYQATVASGAAGGKSFPVTVTDAQGRTASASIAFTVITLTPTSPTATGSANPNPVQIGNSTLLSVTVTPGANPTSTGITVTGDLTSIGGSATEAFSDNGGNVFTFNASILSTTTPGAKSLPISVSDSLGRTASTNISLTVQSAPVLPGSVVISQVYGGGGNTGSTYKNDFIEVFNKSGNPVDITGWSVQYASSTGSSWQVTPICHTGPCSLAPGQYFLVQESANGGGTVNLPTPDAASGILMSATSAKVALVNSETPLTVFNPSGANILDLVGYGTSNFYEGGGPTGTLSAATAALRSHEGCKDTDNNNTDFNVGAPIPRNTSTATHICPPGDADPEIISTTPASNAGSVAVNTNISLTFDEPVNVTGNWFNISCTMSGVHTANVTGGNTTFTLNPDVDFLPSETCTVRIYANSVNDVDLNDPQDYMLADYVWSFGVNSHDSNEHLVMGNPSGATTDVNQPSNYLMEKIQYVLSYSRDRGIPNWVSWHLDDTWTTGTGSRQDDYREDTALPADWYHVQGTSYSGSGFDRGHMCPSADRLSSDEDNSATFLMTNFVPQAHDNNAGPWEDLETYERTLVNQGNEVYIISGGYGQGGTGLNGFTNTINNGHVTVPAVTWKVMLVLPKGNDDVNRVTTATRTIAVIMPNTTGIASDNWEKYLVTVDDVEALTGYDFFSNVPVNIQAVIESKLDGVSNSAPVANNQTVSVAEDETLNLTLTATDPNVNNNLTYSVIGGPANGSLSGTGANLIYTPNGNFIGTDTLTFKASDGQLDSNVATITINVTEVNDTPAAFNDDRSTDEDTPLTFAANDLTANDSAGPQNEGGQTLTVDQVVATPGTHGTVALNGGQITYTPAANYNGLATFDYQVCDNGTTNGAPDKKCATGTVNVSINPVNDAPVLANVPARAAINELANYTFIATANDIDIPAQTLTFSLVGAPAGASIDPSSGQFNWTPSEAQGGTGVPYKFKVSVTDGVAPIETEVTINVNEVNQAPTLAPIGNKIVSLGETLSFTAVGADQDLPAQTLSYSLVGTVPQGATINSSTGEFSWTPTAQQVGVYTFKVQVTDSGNLSAEEEISVGVAYTWSNLLAPLSADGSSSFNAGRTVPVKFALIGASSGISNAVATIWLAKFTNGVAGLEFPAVSTSSSTTGNLFRYDPTSGQYIFNLNTKGLTPGVYRLRVDTGDGVLRAVNFTLN